VVKMCCPWCIYVVLVYIFCSDVRNPWFDCSHYDARPLNNPLSACHELFGVLIRAKRTAHASGQILYCLGPLGRV
jgi:hypothetical protein